MGRPIPVADAAVAEAALTTILTGAQGDDAVGPYVTVLLEAASKVKFQPSTRQLVLTFDLAMGGDQGSSSGPVE